MAAFVIGTRGSTLAVQQTEHVARELRRVHPGVAFSLERIRTTADHQPDAALGQLPGIGFFVKELEAALLEGRIDAAVHSMKDLPTVETPGLQVGAITAREDPRDVLVARGGWTLATLPRGARLGTSSPRRAAFLRAFRADLQIVPVRGNVETRLRRVQDGELDAVCLAGAGLRRIGLSDRISEWLPREVMLPAPGQGALGVQVREGDAPAARIVAAADDASSRTAVEAERAVLRRLQGGCRLPVGAHAEVSGAHVGLQAAVISPDGSAVLRGERRGSTADAARLGEALAEDLLSRGAAGLLPSAGERR